MKAYRNDNREYSHENKSSFSKTGMIVWVGSSEYWNHVYLCNVDHRLYIKGVTNFEVLDTFNIRKIDKM